MTSSPGRYSFSAIGFCGLMSAQADQWYALTDQPEWNDSDEAAEPITEQYFEELWARSRAQ